MGRKKLTDIEKAQALTKIGLGVSVIKTAAELKVSRQAVYTLLKSAKGLPEGTVPKRKVGSGRKRKTSAKADNILRREVLVCPSITPATLKKKHPTLLEGVSIRTIQHHLKNDLGLPSSKKAFFNRENEEKETGLREELQALDTSTVAKCNAF